MAKYFNNTRISTYKECPRKYYLRHMRHWTRDGIAPPLVFGLAWHEAMDIVWGGAGSDLSNNDLAKEAFKVFCGKFSEESKIPIKDFAERPELAVKWGNRTPFVGYEMLSNYIAERRPWINARKVIAIEPPFVVDLPELKDTFYIGRMDKVVEEPNGDILLIEHKTTALYDKAKGFRDAYVQSWSPNSQIDGYLHAGHSIYGRKVKQINIDVALVHKTVHDKFKFIPIDRHPDAIRIFLEETEDWISRIKSDQVFPKQTGACGNYAGCTYRDVCKFYHHPEEMNEPPTGFKVDKWEPFNILNISTLGLPPEDE